MPYVYRVHRSEAASPLAVEPSTAGANPELTGIAISRSDWLNSKEPSYRDLQRQAKAAGIKGNQPADKLRKALGVGNG